MFEIEIYTCWIWCSVVKSLENSKISENLFLVGKISHFSLSHFTGKRSIRQWSISISASITCWIFVSRCTRIDSSHSDVYIYGARRQTNVSRRESIFGRSFAGFQCTERIYIELVDYGFLGGNKNIINSLSWGKFYILTFVAGCFRFPLFTLFIPNGHVADEVSYVSIIKCGTQQR